ncbi:DUF6894 family protein [Ancylobacter aquaticus]|uniref:DUF6894 family protein n=1 Tax=Ancylobacter aquaticus TaxID=100 RepID=UPI0010457E80|nr:hypothetical protein [Ancylobacter aquaticus]
MPTYSFKWSDRRPIHEIELTSDDHAWSEAVASVGQLLRDVDGSMAPGEGVALEVFDGESRLIASVSVNAIRHRGGL